MNSARLPIDAMVSRSLPPLWCRRERFVVLTSDIGPVEFFLAAWAAWREDPARCERLHVITMAPQPLSSESVRSRLAASPLAAQLLDSWPPATPNLHRLSFEGGQVQLLLASRGDLPQWLPELSAQVDAFWWGGEDDADWSPAVIKAMARLSAPGASLLLADGQCLLPPPCQADLRSAGFTATDHATRVGTGVVANYRPTFTPRRAPARPTTPASTHRHALIVGAGLAGAATAWALAEQGWSSALLDRHPSPSQETSGNPAGLFHGIVNAQDGHHARFNRAAALEVSRVVRQALGSGAVGEQKGLLRLEAASADATSMNDLLTRLGLPGDYVQAMTPAQAGALCGLPLSQPAWFYPGGGWIRPADLVTHYLRTASAQGGTFQGEIWVQALRRKDTRWQLLDAAGQVIGESEVVVLANANDALRLLANPMWPLDRVRGQISLLPAESLRPLPSVPIAGSGYLLPEVDGLALFGATSQSDDDDPQVRASDHAHNWAQLSRLTGRELPAVMPEGLRGRTGWRCVAGDRLPLIGAVPDPQASGHTAWDQPRKVPRLPGLYVFTALGSRGITWSALGAQVLASAIAGAPAPLESSLLDAVDPARFVSREIRRASANRR